LFIVEQYSHEEIGSLFSQSPSYSKSILSRCLQKLRKKLEVKHNAHN
jgi:DNA-directed RNA polymerase specialized sigma24 family protein